MRRAGRGGKHTKEVRNRIEQEKKVDEVRVEEKEERREKEWGKRIRKNFVVDKNSNDMRERNGRRGIDKYRQLELE